MPGARGGPSPAGSPAAPRERLGRGCPGDSQRWLRRGRGPAGGGALPAAGSPGCRAGGPGRAEAAGGERGESERLQCLAWSDWRAPHAVPCREALADLCRLLDLPFKDERGILQCQRPTALPPGHGRAKPACMRTNSSGKPSVGVRQLPRRDESA